MSEIDLDGLFFSFFGLATEELILFSTTAENLGGKLKLDVGIRWSSVLLKYSKSLISDFGVF